MGATFDLTELEREAIERRRFRRVPFTFTAMDRSALRALVHAVVAIETG